jgi:hypothetical protein
MCLFESLNFLLAHSVYLLMINLAVIINMKYMYNITDKPYNYFNKRRLFEEEMAEK